MSKATEYYADVILPISVPKLFTYNIPYNLVDNLVEGHRVIVPFKKYKFLTGIVFKIHKTKPPYNTKEIANILDSIPTLNYLQRKFIVWISQYYMCSLGDIIKSTLPSGLKITQNTKLQLSNILEDLSDLTDLEREFVNILKEKHNKIIFLKNLPSKFQKIINNLIAKRVIVSFEELKEKYTPKISKLITLKKDYFDENKLKILFQTLEKKPKQLNILLKYFKYVPMNIQKNDNSFIKKKLLIGDNLSYSSLNTLIKKKIFFEKDIIVSRFNYFKTNEGEINLSVEQNKILDEILLTFNKKQTTLLHGITGSGKTEIYITLIKSIINQNGEILFLLPEIALTTQIVQRIKSFFGNELNVYHSKFSANERIEVWNNLKEKKVKIIIGTRSSIFLPFSNLKLIIVDEEHDPSYKQNDPAPRYNARDAALILGKLHNANVLLGSATPSIESYYNSQINKYHLVELNERFSKIPLPEIFLININSKLNSSKKKFNEFSEELINQIELQLKNKNQILIFQNRRGYSTFVICTDCSTVPFCNQCDVSLTYHQKEHSLICHYCNSKTYNIQTCKVCGSSNIKFIGFGTEKLEVNLKKKFHNAEILRMDFDTTKGKLGFEKLINKIKNDNIDIIVGTQMISKGFDFEKLNLVGIIDFDRLIKFPDFRSKERAFQIAVQVSGRSGRRNKRGIVIIQSFDPKQKLLQYIKDYDFKSMFRYEIEERNLFLYPPFKRIIKIILKHKDFSLLSNASKFLKNKLDSYNNNFIVLGPNKPIISKIKNVFVFNIWIKLNNDDKLQIFKNLISNYIITFNSISKFKSISVSFDVDPY